jgi:hypothetical protein
MSVENTAYIKKNFTVAHLPGIPERQTSNRNGRTPDLGKREVLKSLSHGKKRG